MSFNVNYNPTCRVCCKTHGVKHTINIINESNDSFQRYKKMTEYEFSGILKKWLKDFSPCVFCGSKNIFPENIQIGDYKLYDFDRLVNDLKNETNEHNLLIMYIQKQFGDLEFNTGGKQNNDPVFILECMAKVNLLLNELPNNNFIKSKTDGYFSLVISGLNYNGNHSLTIQRFFNFGFDKSEIRDRLNDYCLNYAFQ